MKELESRGGINGEIGDEAERARQEGSKLELQQVIKKLRVLGILVQQI